MLEVGHQNAAIVEKCVFICFLTFNILQAGPSNVVGPGVTFPLLLFFDGSGCVNKALINALKISAVR